MQQNETHDSRQRCIISLYEGSSWQLIFMPKYNKIMAESCSDKLGAYLAFNIQQSHITKVEDYTG